MCIISLGVPILFSIFFFFTSTTADKVLSNLSRKLLEPEHACIVSAGKCRIKQASSTTLTYSLGSRRKRVHWCCVIVSVICVPTFRFTSFLFLLPPRSAGREPQSRGRNVIQPNTPDFARTHAFSTTSRECSPTVVICRILKFLLKSL